MKKTKKVLISLSAWLLAATSMGTLPTNANQVQATETTEKTPSVTDGMLMLNHKTRVYNKKGQKRYSYRGGNGLLENGSEVKYIGTIEAIDNPSVKRYSFHDTDWAWFYLPYKTIKGQQYYNIGRGGYIKSVNVQSINGNLLYTNQTEITTKAWSSSGKIPLYNGHGQLLSKTLKSGQKLVLDMTTNRGEFEVELGTPPGVRNLYRIKDTDEFICDYDIKNRRVRQQMPFYSVFTQVYFIKNAPYYDENGHDQSGSKMTHFGHKGDMISITKAVRITSLDNKKEELFYQVINGGGDFVKASDVKYLAGPQIPVPSK